MRIRSLSIAFAGVLFVSVSSSAQNAKVDVTVRPIDAASVAGFTVCIGTSANRSLYGSEVTSSSGVAENAFQNLPAGETVLVTASKSGFTGQVSDMAWYGSKQHGKTEVRKELALIALAHRGVYVHQSSQASASHLMAGVLKGLQKRRPALFNIYTPCPVEHGLADDVAQHAARLALESRAFPYVTFDPDAGHTWAECLSLDGNPSVDDDWPTYTLRYVDDPPVSPQRPGRPGQHPIQRQVMIPGHAGPRAADRIQHRPRRLELRRPRPHGQVAAHEYPVDVLPGEIGPQAGHDGGILGAEVQIREVGKAQWPWLVLHRPQSPLARCGVRPRNAPRSAGECGPSRPANHVLSPASASVSASTSRRPASVPR